MNKIFFVSFVFLSIFCKQSFADNELVFDVTQCGGFVEKSNLIAHESDKSRQKTGIDKICDFFKLIEARIKYDFDFNKESSFSDENSENDLKSENLDSGSVDKFVQQKYNSKDHVSSKEKAVFDKSLDFLLNHL